MAFLRRQKRQDKEQQQDKGWFAAHGGDEIFEIYVEWRQAAAALADMFERWVHAPPDQVEHSFYAYSAALDQEDAAARMYAEALAAGERTLSRAA